MEKKGIVVLLSGGMDSATLLWLAKKEFPKVYAISFDYGQRHKVELKYAQELARIANVEDHFIVQVPFYKSLKGSALIDENVEVPKEDYPENEPPITTVPMRNLTFLSIASAFADNLELNYIGIGVHALDTPYPDCRPEFIASAEAAINAGSTFVVKTKKRIHIYAPFLGMTKRDIALLGKELGVPFEKTYSCYMGTEPPCGECPTCRQREEALRGIL
ncbi:MAG TPA: 7-cyano-7-deazaguanine synthase QueC [Aquificaceae bacterium]|nr:7-cyano-7-deazaguanine synthase QueC [Aquificaceae bacterium]HIQ49405.1 7-cyano-7-deazaguanine synthase QueC [Aquifex aeolicus]